MKYCRQRTKLEDSKAKAAHEKRVSKKLEKKKAKKAQEANDLPEEEVEDYSKEISNDESPSAQRVRRVQSLRDQNVNFLEGETSGSVRRIHTAELTDEQTDSEVGKVVNSIKAAKASENHVQG